MTVCFCLGTMMDSIGGHNSRWEMESRVKLGKNKIIFVNLFVSHKPVSHISRINIISTSVRVSFNCLP